MKQSPVGHGSLATHVPSFPGDTSQVAPNLVHAADGAGVSFFFSAGGHPRSMSTASKERIGRRMLRP